MTTTTYGADQRWRDQARCRETDPEVFFPEKGRSSREARRVCAACEVRAECLADALARYDVGFGVLGGLTPVERRRLLQTPGTATDGEAAQRRRRWVA